MAGTNAERRVARDRDLPLKAYVTPAERKAIKAQAKAVGLTLSSYIRAACMGVQIRSVLDLEAVAKLAKVHADQGRLGGLLKMYLQDSNPDHRTAERLLAEIEAAQAELKAALRKVAA